jgi:hypothetical protein
MAVPAVPTKAKAPLLTRTRDLDKIVDGWRRAADLTPEQVECFKPTEVDISVGEALLAGNTQASRIAEYSGLDAAQVRDTLNNPIAMAWLSRQITALFTHRAALVDALLYQRAMTGDLAAIKLFYDRMRLLDKSMEIKHAYSGEVSLKQIPDDELARMVQDKARLLPAEFRVISQDANQDLDPSSLKKEK